VTTHVLNFKLELALGSLVGALEGQVLKEVGSSIGLIGLCTGTGVDVYADGAGGSVGVVFGSNGKTVGQLFKTAISLSSNWKDRQRDDVRWSTGFEMEGQRAKQSRASRAGRRSGQRGCAEPG
jgi:hypothetical protein